MSIRVIGSATLAATATGIAGVASGVAFSAWVLMALGLALTVVAVGLAVTLAVRNQRHLHAETPASHDAGTATSQVPAEPKARAATTEGESAPVLAPEEEPTKAPRPEMPFVRDESPPNSDTSALPPAEPEEASSPYEESPLPSNLREPAGVGPREVLEAFLLSSEPVGDVLAAHLWLHDAATGTMRLVDSVGSVRPSPQPLPASESIVGSAVTTGAAQMSRNVRLKRDGEQSTVWRFAVPLETAAATGAAALDILAEQPDESFLTAISDHLHGALAAALAIHVSRTETDAARALLAAAGDIVRLVDPQAIVESGLERAMAISDAQSGSVMLLESDGSMRIRAASGLPENVVATAVVREGDGIAGVVLATAQSLVVEDVEGRGPRATRHGVRSAVAVPITDDDGLLGVLNVGSERFHARFSATHIQTLESLGKIIGMALRNAWSLTNSSELYLDTVKALAKALEAKDPYLQGSTERVYALSAELGKALGLSGSERRALGVAALLHDIGMVAAGDLAAVGDRPLTTVERGLLKMHPVIAADLLGQAAALKDAVPIVYHHHERFDGTGYVLGVAGQQIPIGARVLSVVDAYVSMTSPRAYREPRTSKAALDELRAHAGTQFDPRVVEAFLDLQQVAEPAQLES